MIWQSFHMLKLLELQPYKVAAAKDRFVQDLLGKLTMDAY